MKKKVISIILAMTFIFSCLPLTIMAADADTTYTEPTIYVENTVSTSGTSIDVNLYLVNNPGIAGARISISFDPLLTLTSAASGALFSELDYINPGMFVSPCNFNWDSENAVVRQDGLLLTLTFSVSPDATVNDNLDIAVSYRYGDIYDENLESLEFNMVDGYVKVIDYVPGDVNSDGVVNGKDVTLIRRYNAGGYDVTINDRAADVNNDGYINGKDVTLLRRYNAGGYGVELKPSENVCTHTMEETPSQEATCTENGNIAYWHCNKCNKYFSDAAGINEISFADTIANKKDHTVVIDPAVEATYESTGLTEGKHCSECGAVITAQIIIPQLQKDEYTITYYCDNNDSYLQSINIENPNPTAYSAQDGVAWLEDLVISGYNFEGWFDGQGSAASRVTSIPEGTVRNIRLYAKWTKEEYKITFDNSSMNLPSSYMKYTVDQNETLDKPTVDRYVFLGWTTDKDELVSEIKAGTTGNFTLHSNWTSKRNLAKPVANLGTPIIVEDTNNGRLLFTYEIGQVENVPLYTIKNLPSAGGVVSVYSETVNKSISTTDASTIAKAIDHITTDSTAWTLSEDWNETTHIEDSVLEEHGYDKTSGQSVGKTSSNTYTLTTNEYDNTVVKANEGSVATTTQYNTKDVDSRETWESKASLSVSDTQSAKYTDSEKISAEAGFEYGGFGAKVGASAESSTEISSSTTAGASAETTVAHENSTHSKTGTDKVTVEDNTKTTTSDKGWNKAESSSSTASSSLTKYEEETLSERIANQYTYGQSYAKGGSNSNSAASSTSLGESDQYSTTFTYFNSEEKTEGVSYTINGETDGSYRLIKAGIVHVFAVVIYDIANAQYSVTTYAVLDDETYTYIDYSATSAAKFDDNENGVLPFEIPFFVNDYVNGRIVATEGLEYNESTLSTGKYEGSETSVIIPEFFALDNLDDTRSAYTVRNISADTFAENKDIKSVILSSFIREIPNSAFAGCTSLQFMYGSEIASIGDNAFDGCASLGEFKVSSTIKHIGTNAFNGVGSVFVDASSKDVVFGAINSGAKKITINISEIADEMSNVTLDIPSTVEYFELQGGRKNFKDLIIKSDAGATVLNGVTITDVTGIPLEISSESLTLNQVIVESPSYVLLLKSEAPTVSLYGTSKFISSFDNAVVCRNISFNKISSNVTSQLEITGNLLSYGEPVNASFISFPERGKIVKLTADEYDKYIRGIYNITFDANGGTVETTTKIVMWNSEIGELPIPTKENCTFDGWFTADNTQITPDTVLTLLEYLNVKAHWTSDWVLETNVPDGAEISEEKWSYDLTSHTSATTSTLDGWSLSGSDITGWGAWSNWQNSAIQSSASRQVQTRYISPVYKTQYNYSRYASDNGWSGPSNGYWGGNYCYKYTEYGWTDSRLPIDSTDQGFTIFAEYRPTFTRMWYNESTRQILVSDGYTQYSYRDGVYTYYFTKVDSLESATEPNGTDISNVQKWVQYQVK